MRIRAIVFALAVLSCVSCVSCEGERSMPADPPRASTSPKGTGTVVQPKKVRRPTTKETKAAAQAKLREMNAEWLTDLVPSAPRRRLLPSDPAVLPYSKGRVLRVSILIEPGPPANLSVPTDLSLPISIVIDEDGSLTTKGGDRKDVVAAAKLALDGEKKAFATAAKALEDAGWNAPPKGWQSLLAVARLDPRLPAASSAGEPTWQLIFDPFDEKRGGSRGVLIDARTFSVISPPYKP